jgi:hypothetical protein
MSGISDVYFTLWLQTNPTQTLLILSPRKAYVTYVITVSANFKFHSALNDYRAPLYWQQEISLT